MPINNSLSTVKTAVSLRRGGLGLSCASNSKWQKMREAKNVSDTMTFPLQLGIAADANDRARLTSDFPSVAIAAHLTFLKKKCEQLSKDFISLGWGSERKLNQLSLKAFRAGVKANDEAAMYAKMIALLEAEPKDLSARVINSGKDFCSATNKITLALISAADEYMKNCCLPTRSALPNLQADATSRRILYALLQSVDGIVIGEAHYTISSKKFLIENLPWLFENGVSELFIEHFMSDVHQQELDAYASSSSSAAIPDRLKSYAEMQNRGQMKAFLCRSENKHAYQTLADKFNYLTVLVAAKAAGIHVTAIDRFHSYFRSSSAIGSTDNDRIKTMNHLAIGKINEFKQRSRTGKWVAFVGSTHVNTYAGVPGIAELTGVRGLIVEDSRDNRGVYKQVHLRQRAILPDYILRADPQHNL